MNADEEQSGSERSMSDCAEEQQLDLWPHFY